METTIAKNKISIPKYEYLRLKTLDRRFGEFLAYITNVMDTSEARKEVKAKKIIPQEKLFKKLGF